MAVVRRNILTDATSRQKYVEGVKRLKRQMTGTTTNQLGILGPSRPMSTFDSFVYWHHRAMMVFTPLGNQSGRNAAHMGPVFLPWHRLMLGVFEQALQAALQDTTFGLPYWNWAADGDLTPAGQRNSPLWKNDCMGGEAADGRVTGPFAFTAGDPNSWRVTIEATPGGILRSPTNDRGLRRRRGQGFPGFASPSLPRRQHVTAALAETRYDAPTYDLDSTGFRNRLEGWSPPNGLHNLVHIWIGGDMGPSTSPNDPVFFLNHCNVDRIWEAWMQSRGRNYEPLQNVSAALRYHRIDDQMYWLPAQTTAVRQQLDRTSVFTYDSLAV
jgi:tyrosinase